MLGIKGKWHTRVYKLQAGRSGFKTLPIMINPQFCDTFTRLFNKTSPPKVTLGLGKDATWQSLVISFHP